MSGEAEGRECHLGGRQDSDAQSCSGTLHTLSEMQQGQQHHYGGNTFTRSVGIPHSPQPDDVPSLWERGPGGNGLCLLSPLCLHPLSPPPHPSSQGAAEQVGDCYPLSCRAVMAVVWKPWPPGPPQPGGSLSDWQWAHTGCHHDTHAGASQGNHGARPGSSL